MTETIVLLSQYLEINYHLLNSIIRLITAALPDSLGHPGLILVFPPFCYAPMFPHSR